MLSPKIFDCKERQMTLWWIIWGFKVVHKDEGSTLENKWKRSIPLASFLMLLDSDRGKKMENFIPSSPILPRYDSSLVASHHHTRKDLVLCQAAWRQCHGLGELTQAPTLLNPPWPTLVLSQVMPAAEIRNQLYPYCRTALGQEHLAFASSALSTLHHWLSQSWEASVLSWMWVVRLPTSLRTASQRMNGAGPSMARIWFLKAEPMKLLPVAGTRQWCARVARGVKQHGSRQTALLIFQHRILLWLHLLGQSPWPHWWKQRISQAWLSDGLQDSTIVCWCGSRIYSVSISPFRAFSGPCEEASPKTRTALSSRAFGPMHFSSSQTSPKPLSSIGSRQKWQN